MSARRLLAVRLRFRAHSSPAAAGGSSGCAGSPPRPRDVQAAVARLDALLAGGLSTADALTVGVAAGGREARVLRRVARHVGRGRNLGDALRRADCGLSPADLALVEAGERCGDLGAAVASLRRRLAQRADTRKRLVAVFLYPLALVATTMGVLAPMSIWVLPAFASMYGDAAAELPLATRAVMASGQLIAAYAVHATCAVVASAVAVAQLRRRSTRVRRGLERLELSLPLFGHLARVAVRCDLYATLASLLGAGVDLDEALSLAAPVCENGVLRSRFDRVRPSLRRGSTLSAAIERCGLDLRGQDSAMLRTAEATGDYAGCLERLSSAARVEREEILDRTVRAVQPATITFMAVVVGATVLAVYQPVLGSASLLAGGLK